MTLQRRAGFSLPLFLELTDGDTVVDLVHGADGFLMKSWLSQEAPLKDGGVYRDSPLSDNSSIALAQYANAIEEIVVTQPVYNTTAAANGISKLRRLLRKARDYWNKTGADEIVYLHWQERDEANEQYALVVNGRIPETASLLGDVQTARTGVSIFIERQHWVELVPNTGIARAIGTAQIYSEFPYPGLGDPIYGNVAYNETTEEYEESLSSARDTAFVGNHAKLANITDVWQNLNPAGANSWVQVAPFADTPPYNLMTETSHTNSALYFGIDSTLTNSGPFSSLVFPYEPVTASFWTTIWEYYTGATWAALTVWDNTGPADSGSDSWETDPNGIPKSIHWLQPSDWTTVNLLTLLGGSAPDVTGWWVRCRFTGVVTVAPSMTSELYTISWAHTVIRASNVGAGDLDPIIRAALVSQVGDINSNILATNKLWVGTRRLDRGTGFIAFLNAAEKQNPSGVTFGGAPAIANTPLSHTGQRAVWTPGSNSDSFSLWYWTLDSTIAPDYTGKFRMFARMGYGGDYAQGDFKFKGFASVANEFVSSTPIVAPTPAAGANKYQLIELGDITIPIDIKGIDQIIFWLGIAPVNGSGKTIYAYDLILIPADEWFGYFQGFYTLNKEPLVTGTPTALDIDPLTFPRSGVKAHLEEDIWGSPIFVDGWRVVSSGRPKLQIGRDQQIWFLMDKYDASDTDNPPDSTNCYPEVAASPRIFRQARFLGSRG